MKNVFTSIVIVSMLTLWSLPANAQETSIGQRAYFQDCAACHGASGKGNGPIVEFLNVQPTDLTMIAKNNGGVFPFSSIYDIIDGKQQVKAHGSRDMPVWGSHYQEMASSPLASDLLDDETIRLTVRTRILATIDYLFSIQEQ